jgi:cysteinyl-tRNA synthetase
MSLRIYNTLSKKKEDFESLEDGKVRMYNCGPTVYSYAHIGNFASFLMADLLRRYLEYSGYEVEQVMNITDVGHLTEDDLADAQGEDKMVQQARKEKKTVWEIAASYTDSFHEDRKHLNLLDAHVFPKATDHIGEMIEIIEELLEKGLAYESADQVYFSIDAFPQYGMLSGNTIDELAAGHRVETDPNKRNPLDFTLWKKDPKHLMQWDSPWGRGFPGWHIECSAMSRKYLGDVFDVHTGGEDNIFPHHECEIAQSSAGEGRLFARYWLHRRHILSENKKMAKSAGNFYTIRDLLEQGFSGLEVRYLLISAHYRTNLNFTLDGVKAAGQALRKLREFRDNMGALPEGDGEAGEMEAVESLGAQADSAFRAAMDDDLNISGALGQVHTFISSAYKTCRTRAAGEKAVAQLVAWDSVLGVLDARDDAPEAPSAGTQPAGAGDDEIEALVRQRDEARAGKDFASADRLRDELQDMGIVLKDSPSGTRWQRGG